MQFCIKIWVEEKICSRGELIQESSIQDIWKERFLSACVYGVSVTHLFIPKSTRPL